MIKSLIFIVLTCLVFIIPTIHVCDVCGSSPSGLGMAFEPVNAYKYANRNEVIGTGGNVLQIFPIQYEYLAIIQMQKYMLKEGFHAIFHIFFNNKNLI